MVHWISVIYSALIVSQYLFILSEEILFPGYEPELF